MEPYYDSLRCWPFPPLAVDAGARTCAENVVTIGQGPCSVRDSGVASRAAHCPHLPACVRVSEECQGSVRGDEGIGLDEEGVLRLLEGGDRTVGAWEGGLEMGEDMCRRAVLCR
jgi:hypothetical protein